MGSVGTPRCVDVWRYQGDAVCGDTRMGRLRGHLEAGSGDPEVIGSPKTLQ